MPYDSANPKSCTIVCCSDIANPDWRWIEHAFLEEPGIRFEFARRPARRIKLPFDLARIRCSWNAVRLARRHKAQVLVAHGPTLAAWCALFARAYGLKTRIIGHTFNFTALPPRFKRWIFAIALSRVERFVVFSSMERQLYAKAFNLPQDRFDVVLWGVRPPPIDTPDVPLEAPDYVCAIGGNARDYRTLVEAARQLPSIRFVVVVRPDNLSGLDIPANLSVRTNIPLGAAMNILLHSRFMALPLIGSEIPCGHVTLVAAMHLGKTFVITDSTGVQDYVHDGENALTVAPGSATELAKAIERLWQDPGSCTRLGEAGRQFALRECSEERIIAHLRNWLALQGYL